jgi:hypothetical protein
VSSNFAQSLLLPELELLLAIYPVAAITVGLVLRLYTAAEGYTVARFMHTAVCGLNEDAPANPEGAFAAFFVCRVPAAKVVQSTLANSSPVIGFPITHPITDKLI